MPEMETYMRRCFELALLGAGHVAPNPMVGAIIVHNGHIIGEGWHRQYGKAHAEVNAVANVLPQHLHLLPHSTMYVSLEPCCIHGNTPPCTDLIIKHKIGRVVICCNDDTPGVEGRSSRLLREAGIDVTFGVLEAEGRQLAARRNTFVSQQRPYIILKWAQSQDGFMGKAGQEVAISNALTKRLVHRWRSEEAAILVGKQTILSDNPELTNRLYFGKHPLRLVLGKASDFPEDFAIFSAQAPTLFSENLDLTSFLSHLYTRKIQSILVEGGAKTLNSFMQAGLYDEIRCITAQTKYLNDGIPAPKLPAGLSIKQTFELGKDRIEVFLRR